MTNWSEAGRKAWATRQANEARRIRDLYRAAFSGKGKAGGRRLAMQALVNAGGTRCLDLWGGGLSADLGVSLGLSVLSVDNGYELTEVAVTQRQEALRRAGEDGGYDTYWGEAIDVAAGCDVAFLDFCGIPSADALRLVEACRHMKAVAVTFTTGHDHRTGAPSQRDRRDAYLAFLRKAYRTNGRGHDARGQARVLCEYRNDQGRLVFVFLCLRRRPVGPIVPWAMQESLNQAVLAKKATYTAAYRRRHPERVAEQDAQYRARTRAETAAKRAAMPDLTCQHCGVSFRSYNYQARFCSTKCQQRRYYLDRKGRLGERRAG
jgi:hypothetical protein